MKHLFASLLVSLLIAGATNAQYYETGQDPASLKWQQIRTPHFRVIFPGSFASQGKRYATLLEDAYGKISLLYPDGGARIPVIIHNYSMESNGYVSWAPRRMELYPLPGNDNLPMDPMLQLTLHEVTHVMQLSSLKNRGAGKLAYYLLGEQAVGISALEIPAWAFEGDAVYTETLLSLSGRGRSNVFLQRARALMNEKGGIYGYDKMISGSYRSFTPDHYVFGYLMMNELRSRDQQAWAKAIRSVSSGIAVNPLNYSLKRSVNLTKKRLYDSTFAGLEKSWNAGEKEEPIYLTKGRKGDYVSYYSPYLTGDNRIISLSTSLSIAPRFVITDALTGKDSVITTTGNIYPYTFSYSNGIIVWAELHPHPRWENLDYSVIKKLNLSNGLTEQLTFKTRLTAPDISPDGRMVAAVNTTPGFLYSLAFIDINTGEIMMDAAVPGNTIIQRPAWTSDGTGVTVISLTDEGEGIRTYYPTGKRWVINRPETITDIIMARITGDTLYYLAQGDGSDNIYRIAEGEAEVRVTDSRYGISGFSLEGCRVICSDYTARGFMVLSGETDRQFPASHQDMKDLLPGVAAFPVSEAENRDDFADTTDWEITPYRKTAHLFNFHSWFPFYTNIDELQSDFTAISPGITLQSQNQLSTLISSIGYEYSSGNHIIHSRFDWKGWLPFISADLSYGGNPVISKPSNVTVLPSEIQTAINLTGSITLPLYFSYSKFRQLFMPGIYVTYRNSYSYINDSQLYDKDVIHFTGRLYFSNVFRSAWRDIYPRWGQVIDLGVTGAPWDRDLYHPLGFVKGTLFMPGIVRNHGIRIRAGYESQSSAPRFLYYNRNSFPRGYENLVAEKLSSFSADYTMPLLYPDISAGSLVYLKRIRGSLFADFARGSGISDLNTGTFSTSERDFRSLGGELLADFYLLRFPFEISAGISGGYRPGEGSTFISGVFTVNIYGTVLGKE